MCLFDLKMIKFKVSCMDLRVRQKLCELEELGPSQSRTKPSPAHDQWVSYEAIWRRLQIEGPLLHIETCSFIYIKHTNVRSGHCWGLFKTLVGEPYAKRGVPKSFDTPTGALEKKNDKFS